MFSLTHEWILANQRQVRFCVGGGGVKFWASIVGGGELTEKIPDCLSIETNEQFLVFFLRETCNATPSLTLVHSRNFLQFPIILHVFSGYQVSATALNNPSPPGISKCEGWKFDLGTSLGIKRRSFEYNKSVHSMQRNTVFLTEMPSSLQSRLSHQQTLKEIAFSGISVSISNW